MAAPPQERVRKRLVWFSPVLLAVALSPAFLQVTCEPRTGDTRLASFELEVQGVNRLVFDPAVRVYDLWLPAGATTATVRAVPMDPAARVTWYVPDGAGMLAGGIIGVGGGEVTVDLPPDGYSLYIGVFPPGGATNTYIVAINPACSPGSPCSDGNECTTDFCNPSTEQCMLTPVADGVACDFGGLPGLCFAGVCEENDLCPVLTRVLVTPLQADVGDEITVSAEASDEQGDMIAYLWSGSGGVFEDPSAASTTYTCLEIGQHDINIAVSDDGFTNCIADWTLTIECLPMCTDDVDCDDGNDCAADVCDPANGSCTNDPVPDGTLCGVDGVCDAGACRERSWGTPVLIETGAGDAYYPEIAVDPNGNATAVWRQDNGANWDIWANRYISGVGWNTAVVIDGAAGDAYGPEVAVDANGNATAVWRQYSGTDWNVWSNRYTPGVGWGTAVLIENGAGEAYYPEVAVDPNGNATAVWQQYNGADWDIWANRYTAGVGWGTGLLIDSAAGEANGPEVAVDANGNATAVWQQYNGADWDIWANRYTAGVGWGGATVIENGPGGAYDARLAVDPSGNATAVWQQYNGALIDIWANRYTPGVGWGTAVVIDGAAGEGKDPQVAVDPNGNAAAVWRQYNGASNDIWANRYVSGVGWNTAVLIESAAGEAYDPEIAFDPDGNATVVWEQKNGADWDIWANRYISGVGWNTAVLIESATGSFAGGAPQIDVDPDGNATAVWGGHSSVWSNRFE